MHIFMRSIYSLNLFSVMEWKNQESIQISLQGIWAHTLGPNSAKRI